MQPQIRYGVVGIHGFSRCHIRQLEQIIHDGAPATIVAAVAHAREQDEEYAATLETVGIKLLPDLDAILGYGDAIDIITLPVGTPRYRNRPCGGCCVRLT